MVTIMMSGEWNGKETTSKVSCSVSTSVLGKMMFVLLLALGFFSWVCFFFFGKFN